MTEQLKQHECVTFHSKRDFADGIKFRILRWGDYSQFPNGPKDKSPHKEKMEVGESEEEPQQWK